MQPSNLTKSVTRDILAMLDGEPDRSKLESVLRHLAKWRSALLETTLVGTDGQQVLGGPFKGMNYAVRSTEGAGCARRIGCYEHSLTPIIEEIIKRAYPVVLDIGSAEGYYAVGLARRMPGTRVHAHDSNPRAQEACARLAELNEVTDRVEISGTLDHEGLACCADRSTLVLCDIEGAEGDLLDPDKAPALKKADILVEVHDCFAPGLSDTIAQRFEASHDITRIGRAADMNALPGWMENLSDLDRVLALWEWRAGPTPWLWMRAHEQP